MKPLYIEASPAAAVRLDGSALHVCRPECAPVVIGLRNVSQIIASGRTRFTSTALEGCMRNGISIVFLDRTGQVEGFLHGLRSKRGHLPMRLSELFGLPNGARIYRAWWKAMENRRRCRLAKRLRVSPDRHPMRNLKAAMHRARLQRAPEAIVTALYDRWHSGTIAVAQQLAQDEGFNAAWQRRMWPRCDLVADLAALVEWELFLPSLTELSYLGRMQKAGVPEPMLRARILARFETHRPALLECGAGLLQRLDLRLMELGLV